MGYLDAAIGYLIAKDGGFSDYILTVCKSVTVKKTGTVLRGHDIAKYFSDNDLYVDDCFGDNLALELYDDIIIEDNSFAYKENPKFHIGESTRDVMIFFYVGVRNAEFSDEDLQQFIAWKNKLVEEGRVAANIKFHVMENC